LSKQEKHQEPDSEKKELKPRAQNYMKYSGMAFQMGIIIALGAFAGQWLDEHYQTSKPYFTVGLSLFAIFVALYSTLKDFIITKK